MLTPFSWRSLGAALALVSLVTQAQAYTEHTDRASFTAAQPSQYLYTFAAPNIVSILSSAQGDLAGVSTVGGDAYGQAQGSNVGGSSGGGVDNFKPLRFDFLQPVYGFAFDDFDLTLDESPVVSVSFSDGSSFTHVLGGVGQGARVLMSGLDYERAVLSGGPLGIMQAVMDNVIPYVHERKQFGQAIGEFQLLQGKLADMYTVQQAARALAYTVAKNLDALGTQHARHVRKDCAALILWTAEKATWMAGEGIQIFGGNGYINDYPLGRLWRDAKLYEIGAGTSEIRRMLIGRELFAETA